MIAAIQQDQSPGNKNVPPEIGLLPLLIRPISRGKMPRGYRMPKYHNSTNNDAHPTQRKSGELTQKGTNKVARVRGPY